MRPAVTLRSAATCSRTAPRIGSRRGAAVQCPRRRNSNRALRYPHTGRRCRLPHPKWFAAALHVPRREKHRVSCPALRRVSGSPPVGPVASSDRTGSSRRISRFARRRSPLRSRRCARSRPRGRWLRRVLALAAQARCILAADQPRRACGLRPPSHLGAEPAAPRSGASAGEKPNHRGQRKTKPRRRRAGGGGGSESPVREKWGPSLASQVRETFATTKHTLS